jgi:hypothetical protein
MRLVGTLTLGALALSALGMAIGTGCGSTANGPDGGSGTDSGGKTDAPTTSEGGGGMSVTPPTMPTGPKTTSTTPQNFAINNLFLGDTNFMGVPSSTAWASFGYNIDGLITTAASTNVCTLVAGASANPVQVDGPGGVDNSFGENIVTLIGSLISSMTVDSDIDEGKFTLMFDITGLDGTATQTSTALSAQAFAGGTTTSTPDFTSGTFNWPILGGPGLLKNSTPPFQSDIQFTDSYVVNGTWVSGAPSTINLDITFDGITLTLPIAQAVITFEHTMPNHAANGIVSGVLPITSFVAAINAVAAEKMYCSVVGDFLPELEQDADILSDGSNHTGVTCDAISIGLGFTADVIAQPTTIAPTADGGGGGPKTCDGGT